jgi:hypothetical protein
MLKGDLIMEKDNRKSSNNNNKSKTQTPKSEKSSTGNGQDEFSRELTEIINSNIQPEENKNKPNYRRYK